MWGYNKSQEYGERALANQRFHENQAARYSERAGQAKTAEEWKQMMDRGRRAIEKADYWEAERM